MVSVIEPDMPTSTSAGLHFAASTHALKPPSVGSPPGKTSIFTLGESAVLQCVMSCKARPGRATPVHRGFHEVEAKEKPHDSSWGFVAICDPDRA